MEYRTVIKFFVLEALSAIEIHAKLVKVLKESAPSFPTVHGWTLEFKCGRTNVNDNPHSGRPKTATIEKTVVQVQDMVTEGCRLTVDDLAEAIKASHKEE